MKYAVQDNAWMDEKHTLDWWVEKIWKLWAATKKGTTYFLMDEFTVHMTNNVKMVIMHVTRDCFFYWWMH
jgi:hypothetical protein